MASPVDRPLPHRHSTSAPREPFTGGLCTATTLGRRPSFDPGTLHGGGAEISAIHGRHHSMSPRRDVRFTRQNLSSDDSAYRPGRMQSPHRSQRSVCPFALDDAGGLDRGLLGGTQPFFGRTGGGGRLHFADSDRSKGGRRFQSSPRHETWWLTGRDTPPLQPSPRSCRPQRTQVMESPWAESYPPPPEGETPQRGLPRHTPARRPSPVRSCSAKERNLVTLDGVEECARPSGTRKMPESSVQHSQLRGGGVQLNARARSLSEPRLRTYAIESCPELRQGRKGGWDGGSTLYSPAHSQRRGRFCATELFNRGLTEEDPAPPRPSYRQLPSSCNVTSLSGASVRPDGADQAPIDRRRATPHRRPERRRTPYGVENRVDPARQWVQEQRDARRSQGRPNYWQNRMITQRGRGAAPDGELCGGAAPEAHGSAFPRSGRASPRGRRSSLAGTGARVEWT
eukprot:TRINITY_DN17552_c0_g1_i1.p1 TRINITY_DN17552_c0_g1~~TRINITY_DN17552_c0_g1_i1.p1  ORF type:complete len:455 (+),score=55.48 TRINITY_DN17552_c0_g1_i1:98-1462(+)